MHQQVEQIQKAAKAISQAKYVLISAGAGLGVDSGLPDFRGTEGFWRAYPPMAKLGLRFEQMSTPKWYDEDPCFAWGFMGHRYQLYTSKQPHEGYQILKKIGERVCTRGYGDYFVFSSNVDGHFIKAGFPENKIVECHGSLQYLQYVQPSVAKHKPEKIFPAEKYLKNLEIDEESFRVVSPDMLPRRDGHLLRPNVLQFYDSRWESDRCDQQEERFEKFSQVVSRYSKKNPNSHDHVVVIELGAGVHVPTVRRASESFCATHGGTLIRINPRDSHGPEDVYSHQFIGLAMGALKAMKQIEQELQSLHFFE